MEYHKNQDLTDFELEKLMEFRNRLNELIINPSENDEGLISEYIIRFLRFKTYDVEAAWTMLLKSLKLGLADDIAKIPYEEYKRVYDAEIISILKKRAQDGSKIVLVKPRNWNLDEIDVMTYFAAVYHYVDEALYSQKSQKYGFSVIVDGYGVGFVRSAKILSYFTTDIIRQLGSFVQGAYPCKLKAVHHINSSMIMTTFYAGIKYILSKKLRNRYNVHHKGAEVLLKYFDKTVLPDSLNGCIPDEDAIDVKLLKALHKRGVCGGSNPLTLRKYVIIPN